MKTDFVKDTSGDMNVISNNRTTIIRYKNVCKDAKTSWLEKNSIINTNCDTIEMMFNEKFSTNHCNDKLIYIM